MSDGHIDPAGGVIFWGTLLLFLGIIGRYIARRFNQSGVLGELLMGVFIGNILYFSGTEIMYILRDSHAIFNIVQQILEGVNRQDAVNSIITEKDYAHHVYSALSGIHGNDYIKITYVIDSFSRYGVIFLLFMVGLESSVTELKKTGRESILVALIGVIMPVILGVLSVRIFMPTAEVSSALFIGAALSATSVGITARVFKDLHKLNTREAKTILGAAMLDDILGLVLLAIISGMVVNHNFDVLGIGGVILICVLFFPTALLLGPIIIRKMIKYSTFLDPWESKLLISYIVVMGFSWLATIAQMSSIIGAFVAGIILHDGFFESREKELKNPLSVKNLMIPFEVIFAPLFFIIIGIQVRIETFFDWHVLSQALVLIIVAIIGKVISGLGANKKDDRLLIGIGMMPRGEVGLIFASVGKSIGVIDDALFTSVVLMIVATTILTPFLLKKRFLTR